MKKGLSVLLIVAALFGFYGGASSLTDVLACKDYWEKEGEKSTADMNKLEDGLNQLGENEQAYLDGVQKLAENEPKLEEGKQTLAEKEAEFAAAPAKLRKGEADLAAGKAQYDAGKKAYADAEVKFAKLEAGVNKLGAGFTSWHNTYAGDGKTPGFKEKYTNPALIGIGAIKDGNAQDVTGNEAVMGGLMNALQTAVGTDTHYGQEDFDKESYTYYLQCAAGLSDASTAVSSVKKIIAKAKEKGHAHVKAAATNIGAVLTAKGLHDGKATIVDGLTQLLGELKTNEDANKAVKKMGIPDVATLIKVLPTWNDEQFDTYGAAFLDAANKLVEKSRGELAAAKKQLSDAEKKLAAGKKEIKAGEAKLAQGYADYKAAPAKLAAGRQQLADGLKQLEEGKKQLAQYEDGEQQVRDGLATLMSTEPNGGLESILDRRGGDDEFDDANGHLDIKEGLDAVDVGRGYQADSGELITKEITNRAVGTAAGLGAAVLACLAALLSLIKKYKGAAVTAVLAAIAGVAGAVVGNGAGSEFSNIAGSTVGSLPWIAAGVVAAVACVFAIVHFTAKAE